MTAPRFDTGHLDDLMEEAGIDVLVATSPHNVRYLVGSYSGFHASFDAIGVDRYLPAVVYWSGHSDRTLAIGADIDAAQHEVDRPWVPELRDASQTSTETALLVAGHLRGCGLARAVVGLELSFSPHRFVNELVAALPGVELVEATAILEELRAIKRPEELALLREAAELIVESIAATVAVTAGWSTRAIADRLRLEEETRGLRFEYCLAAAGPSFNRAPSERLWGEGEVLSLDSGGRRRGYIGDLCRMAVNGQPSAQMNELLAEVRAVQEAARGPIAPGAVGAEIYEAAAAACRSLPHADQVAFVAHGMGLIPHEAPRLDASAPIRYPATHRERALQPGMVLSIETDLRAEGVGLIKLEDTVIVTSGGSEGYGDAYRDWLIAGIH